MSEPTSIKGAVVYMALTITKFISSVGLQGYFYNNDVPKKGHGCKKGYPAAEGYNVEKDPKIPAVTVENYFEKVFLDKRENSLLDPYSNAFLLMLRECVEHIKSNNLTNFSLTTYVIKSLLKNWQKAETIVSKGGDQYNDSGDEIIDVRFIHFVKEYIPLREEFISLGGVLNFKLANVDKKPGFGEGLAIVLSEMPFSDFKIDFDQWHRFSEVYATEIYWNYTYTNHRLLGAGRWFFTVDKTPAKTPEGEWIYLMARRLKEDEEKQVGKMIPNTGLSVVLTKEPEPLLEIVRRKQTELTPNSSFIFRASTTDIFSNNNAYHILNNPDFYIKRSNRINCNLELPGKLVITEECNPPLLSYRIMEEYETLYSVYEAYKANNVDWLSVTDITTKFYDIAPNKAGEMKYIFKKEFPVGIKKLTLPVIYDKEIGKKELLLTFNIDLPDRNALSGIADEKPKISVVVWKQALFGHRFAVVIETEAVKGIWAGVYSNLIWKHE